MNFIFIHSFIVSTLESNCGSVSHTAYQLLADPNLDALYKCKVALGYSTWVPFPSDVEIENT